MLNIALPKGRLANSVYERFAHCGITCTQGFCESRQLIFDSSDNKMRFLLVKPSDVAVYVQRGAADIGICGSDILREEKADVYELTDLKLGVCHMMVAAKKDFIDDKSVPLKVATKYPNIASAYYEASLRKIDIITLHGSIELAPIIGLSDVIVDIVETGSTLKENDLVELNKIMDISARLISNKSSYKFKRNEIELIKNALEENL